MAKLPCILCGKEINAAFGSNTIYYPATAKSYACCTGGCGSGGREDTDVTWRRIQQKTDADRERSQVPDAES